MEQTVPHPRHVLQDLSEQATKASESVDNLLSQLKGNLQESSKITLENVDVYLTAATSIKQQVDSNIANTLALIMSCDHLVNDMTPVQQIALQIRDIKQSLDTLEALYR